MRYTYENPKCVFYVVVNPIDMAYRGAILYPVGQVDDVSRYHLVCLNKMVPIPLGVLSTSENHGYERPTKICGPLCGGLRFLSTSETKPDPPCR